MNTAVLRTIKWDVEKVLITTGMLFLEGAGMIMLICGILNIKFL